MPVRVPRRRGLLLTVPVVVAALAACGGGHDEATDARSVQDTVKRSIDAENAGDGRAFVALWTDDGLRSYDAGSRDEIESGASSLGTEQTELRTFVETSVDGDKAVATIDGRVEIGLYRMRFNLVRTGSGWRIDGFRFLGATPPPPGLPVIDVRAVDYGFDVDRAALSSGEFGLYFVNAGQEQHEISIISVPAGLSTADAVFALKTANASGLAELPTGYAPVGHLAFEAPGTSGEYTLAAKLPPGHYALACFLPVGGLDDFGNAKVPGSEPHVARGMLAQFTVA
ncbi:MAG: nuclear transport factor 2 family protein [Actinomycetota bacterium]|nr:nuclear transport factor 2 family protein [Actinomycetota bacterium]